MRTGANSDNNNKIRCLILFIDEAIFTILLKNGNKSIMDLFLPYIAVAIQISDSSESSPEIKNEPEDLILPVSACHRRFQFS